jgi:1-deoxy-D-xylulose-5-phosphate reductoisomerase
LLKNIIILGSTGSIGTQTLDVCKMHNINVIGLSANKNIELLKTQVEIFHPKYVCITNSEARDRFERKNTDKDLVIFRGNNGLQSLITVPEEALVLNAIVGIAGLFPTMAAIESGRILALANKESLVTGGKLVTEAVLKRQATLIPVDSEHSAIFQCLQDKHSAKTLKKIILTASGGPFFGYSSKELESVTKAQALKHPNWSMGSKITVDSATLMNKGLELIEAVWLFGVSYSDVEIVVHRQSIIHSAVEFSDNSIIAQMGVPDMRIPIQYAVTYPDRFPSPAKELNLFSVGNLTFERPDPETFLCLKAAVESIKAGGLRPCIVNGANERAVELFLKDKIKFTDIGELVYSANKEIKLKKSYNIDDIYQADKTARKFVDKVVSDWGIKI